MNKEQKQKLALAAILSLLVIKYFILPALDKQEDLLSQISQSNKSISRYQQLLSQETEFNAFAVKLDEFETAVNEKIPSFSSSSDFMLKTQRQLEDELTQNKLRVNRINWFDDNEKVADGIFKKRLSINFTGLTKNTLLFHEELFLKLESLKFSSISVQISSSSEQSMGYSTVTIVVDAFYREVLP